ncbi:amino acid/amide ABC transporter substrate-binding protein (HAAT family) [Pseudoduganella flava]|uniref:ABC transporter substrate-binding protein n=1 Tax=Pseudoduganella flava TaxID=871742 RepID=A0A562PSD3_9BURK|nr:branched-chain amino acid ABC transporter substrate-binding protein [Pseudoduganella flava]QGZ39403.1 ABC transporter substrate-binding protein [Pseudoduganella flava]TWI47283.1 amino acid/amide ABC transporter substrate-binding protein (HAAT family) [Pseudoduganella flava]
MQLKLIPLAALLAAGAGGALAQEVVKIGYVGPLSGQSAHLGTDTSNGARLAVEDLNAKGFKIDGKPVKFVLMAEDDAAEPKQATTAAQKLADQKVNGVIGHQTSGTSIPASRIYYNAGIPQISASATSPVYTHQKFNTTFRVVANDNKLGASLGDYAVKKLGAKKVAVIDDRTAYGQGLADEFAKSARKAGVQIVAREFTNDKATDFNAILTSIRAKNPDLVFFGGMDSVGGPLARQMKALGIKTKLMGGDGICTEAMPRLAGTTVADETIVCAEAGGVTPAQQKTMAEFAARYKKRYGQELQIYAPYSYDATMAMAAAMANAKSADPKKYLPYLAKVSYPGITGTIAFDPLGDIKDGALTLFTFKGGKKTLIEVVK